MGLLECASGPSVWRGYDYYKKKKVVSLEEIRQEELYDKVCHYVWHMKKSELQEVLLQLLFEGPEWQYDRFLRDNGLEEGW